MRAVGKAHQRVIRERRAQATDDLFGAWWKGIDTDIATATIQPISRSLCQEIILEYEWLGCMPAVTWFHFGIFFGRHCGGVVCYGPEYSENLGIQAREQGRKCADWSKYGYEGRMILLSRGACTHWAHPHSASKLIRGSMKLLPEKYEVVTATTDEAAGEIGTIYQACGFHYVGSMRDANPNVTSTRLDRDAWKVGDKLYSMRSIRAQIGNCRQEDILARWPNAVRVRQHSKHRYFAFRGNKRVQRTHLEAIQHLVKPYPKRATHTTESEEEEK